MRSMGVLAVFLAGCGSAEQIDPWDQEGLKFVYLAVIEGLATDGVEPEVLKGILKAEAPGYFIYKCPICEPVRSAFISYVATCEDERSVYRPSRHRTSSSEELEVKLASRDRKMRLEGLQDLVARYVQIRFDRLRMTARERRRMMELLDAAKDYGMNVKTPEFREDCANCLGATRR